MIPNLYLILLLTLLTPSLSLDCGSKPYMYTYMYFDGIEYCSICPPGYVMVVEYNEAEYDAEEPDGARPDITKYCSMCGPGAYSDKSYNACFCCSGGTYSETWGSSECLLCDLGSYSSSCARTCISCPRGSHNNRAGAWSCPLCPMNTFASDPGTINCEICSSLKPADNCEKCPPGTRNNKMGRTSEIACTDCPVGYRDLNIAYEQCEPCQRGTYGDEEGMVNCRSCPAGTHNPNIGSPICLPCNPGTYMPITGWTSCVSCPRGYACPDPGMTTINICQRGTYAALNGQTRCDDCPVGTYNPFTAASSLSHCLRCNPGEYNDRVGQAVCLSCPHNTYNLQMGSTSINNCLKCPTRSYSASPITNECIPCHQYCEECFGPTETECDSCRIEIRNIVLVEGSTCACKKGFYKDIQETSINNICKPCYDLCSACEGSPNHCTECIRDDNVVLDRNMCICKQPYNPYYNRETGEAQCILCHRFCTICHGPLHSQCDECNEAIGVTMVGTRACGCATHSFYNERQNRCVSCHLYCDKCNGASNKNCVGCNTLYSYYVENQPTLCVSSCHDLQGYYLEDNTCKGNLLFNS